MIDVSGKRFQKFCDERAMILSGYKDVSTYINVLSDVHKQRVIWLEFMGLIETAHLVWYYEHRKHLPD